MKKNTIIRLLFAALMAIGHSSFAQSYYSIVEQGCGHNTVSPSTALTVTYNPAHMVGGKTTASPGIPIDFILPDFLSDPFMISHGTDVSTCLFAAGPIISNMLAMPSTTAPDYKIVIKIVFDYASTDLAAGAPAKTNIPYQDMNYGTLPSGAPDTRYFPYALANFIKCKSSTSVTGRTYGTGSGGYDMEIHVNAIAGEFADKWNFSPAGGCPADKYDFTTMLLHEIVHGLGYCGFIQQSGLSASFTGYHVSIFDNFIEDDKTGLLYTGTCHSGLRKFSYEFIDDHTNLYNLCIGAGGYNISCNKSSDSLFIRDRYGVGDRLEQIQTNYYGQIKPYHSHQELTASGDPIYNDLMQSEMRPHTQLSVNLEHLKVLGVLGWHVDFSAVGGGSVELMNYGYGCTGGPDQVITAGSEPIYCVHGVMGTTIAGSTAVWKLKLRAVDGSLHEVDGGSGSLSWSPTLTSSVLSAYTWARNINGRVVGELSCTVSGYSTVISVGVNYAPQALTTTMKNISASGHCDQFRISYFAPGATSYNVKYRSNGSSWSSWTTVASVTTSTATEIPGLNECLPYEFKIEAVNTYGVCSTIVSRPPCAYDVNLQTAITGATTWTPTSNPAYTGTPISTVTVGTDIEIAPGGSLTVSGMTLKMAAIRKIVVEGATSPSSTGGKLIIDGSKITSNTSGCEVATSMWEGIQIIGNATYQQGGAAPQGYVKLVNGGEIANAKLAIAVGTSTTDGGGVVQSYGGRFRNNKDAVVFQPYHNSLSGALAPNISTFYTTTFLWDAAYLGSVWSYSPGTHAKLMDVEGIQFTGCNFLNRDVSSLRGKGNAIHGVNSGFSVFPAASSPGTTNSRFCGFTNGVLIQGVIDGPAISINKADFDSTSIGVNISVHNATAITACNFKIGNGLPVNEIVSQEFLGCKQNIGIEVSNSDQFIIENNNFIGRPNASTAWYNIGATVVNCGNNTKKIYNCRFDSLVRGVLSVGYNMPIAGGSVFTSGGLTVLCNSFDKNYADIDIARQIGSGTSLQGMATGIPLSPLSVAGNTFAHSSLNIINNGTIGLHYQYDGANASTEKPSLNLGAVTATPIDIRKSCPTHYGGSPTSITGLGDVAVAGVKTIFAGSGTTYLNAAAQYSSLIDGGYTVALRAYIDTVTHPDSLYAKLHALAHYVSDGSLRGVIESGILSYQQESTLFAENPDALRKNNLFADVVAYFHDAYLNSNSQLPDYSVVITQVVGTTTVRTQLEATLAQLSESLSEAYDKVHFALRSPLDSNVDVNDTTGAGICLDSTSLYFSLDSNRVYPNFDSVDSWLRKGGGIWSEYARVMLHYRSGHYSTAGSTFSAINSQLLPAAEVSNYQIFAGLWSVLGNASNPNNGSRKFYDLTANERSGLSYGSNPTITPNEATMLIKVIKTWSDGPIIPIIEYACEADYPSGKPDNSIRYPFSEYGKSNNNAAIRIYPNPATMLLYFEFPSSKEVSIKLTDIAGRIMDQQVIHDAGKAAFNVKGYAPGIYVYQVNSNGTIHAGKILVSE